MEKFSAFRDPGTGIQPFLKPVPPLGSDVLASIVRPFGYLVGAVRTLLVVVLALVYFLLVEGVCLLLIPVPPIYRFVTHVFTAILCRLVLLLVGLWWIPVEIVTRKRGRGPKFHETWNPGAGDIIVSNWASSLEILWLAVRFNPIFVLPVCSSINMPSQQASSPTTRTPGRRTGTGSAALSTPAARTPTPRAPIVGFHRISLLSMLRATGRLPLPPTEVQAPSLESIRSAANRPVVVFPECTTSNGRGLLRFADVFRDVRVPVMQFKVFVMCVRYDPPTTFSPTLTQPIPSAVLNPLPHIFSLATSLVPLTLSIRLLAPSEAPSSGAFLLSDFLTGDTVADQLSECCAALIAQIGRFKRLGMGWEDKVAFLELYKNKK